MNYELALQNLRVLIHVGPDKKKEWGKYWIEQGFNGMTILKIDEFRVTIYL